MAIWSDILGIHLNVKCDSRKAKKLRHKFVCKKLFLMCSDVDCPRIKYRFIHVSLEEHGETFSEIKTDRIEKHHDMHLSSQQMIIIIHKPPLSSTQDLLHQYLREDKAWLYKHMHTSGHKLVF